MFERHEIETPFQVGSVNAYFEGRTVVDPGPASKDAWKDLRAGLQERDLTPADVQKVLITHPHPDHFGLARRLRDAGASVLASARAGTIVGDFRGHYEHERAYFRRFFKRHGMSSEALETVIRLPEAYLTFAPNVQIDRVLEPGDQVESQNVTVTVDSLTGHAEGELLYEYVDPDGDRHALVGDHVLPDITPVPLLIAPRRGQSGADRPRVLPAYNRSLSRLLEANYDRVLPGHREEISTPSRRIIDILHAHERRTKRVSELVEGPTTAYEVMEGLFGKLPATEQFPGMSEAVGHLDVLEARNRVESRERGGIIIYRQT